METALLATGNTQRISSPAPLPPACFDRSARLSDDVLDDRETEPRPAGGARVVGAVEALEEPRELLLVDANAVVGASEHDRRRRPSRPRA